MIIDSIINDSAYYNSDKNDAEGDQKSDPLVATHTSDGKKRKVTDTDTTYRNYSHKLLINRTLPVIVAPIDPQIVDGDAAGRGTMLARQMPASKMIVTDATRAFSRLLGT